MKLILFDCDGTLVDSQHVIFAAMSQAFTEAGLTAPERDVVRRVIGLSLVDAVAQCMTPDNSGDATAIADGYRAAFRAQQNGSALEDPLFPGVRKTVVGLAQQPDVLLGVATGKSRRGVDRLFKREQFADLFQTIQTADEHPTKPDPSMIHQAMNETGASVDETVMVGDTTFDIEMAGYAGAASIGVSWGYHDRDDLIAAGASVIVDTFMDIPAAIDAVLAARAQTT